jgi:hypothetical protein
VTKPKKSWKRTHAVKGPLTGQKINSWKVGLLLPDGPNHNQKYQCKCKCGVIKPVFTKNLKKKSSRSCGCAEHTIVRSQKFRPRFYGNFYIESISHYALTKRNNKVQYYNVTCNCGKKVKMAAAAYRYQVGCSKTCPFTLKRIRETRTR